MCTILRGSLQGIAEMKKPENKVRKSVTFADNQPGGKLSFVETIHEAKVCLILFLATTTIYAYFFVPMEKQTGFGMLLKCLPIVALLAYVQLRRTKSDGAYQRKILAGLVLSCIGDAFLDFPGFFLHGTVAFAFAQISNVWAFGMTPLKVTTGLMVLALMSVPIPLISARLLADEELLVLVAVSIYAPLLKVMVWRALARVDCCNASDGKNMGANWSQVFGALGAISFGISDATLALNKYFTPVPFAQGIIMATYYLAQLGITLSTIQPSNEDLGRRKKSN